MVRPIVDPDMDQLGGEMAAIVLGGQPYRMPPVGATWCREIHVGHRMIDCRRDREPRQACCGVRRCVQNVTHRISEESERDFSTREEMAKPAAFAEVFRPVVTKLQIGKLGRECDEGRPPVVAFVVEEVGQLTQCGDLWRGCHHSRRTPGGDGRPLV